MRWQTQPGSRVACRQFNRLSKLSSKETNERATDTRGPVPEEGVQVARQHGESDRIGCQGNQGGHRETPGSWPCGIRGVKPTAEPQAGHAGTGGHSTAAGHGKRPSDLENDLTVALPRWPAGHPEAKPSEVKTYVHTGKWLFAAEKKPNTAQTSFPRTVATDTGP